MMTNTYKDDSVCYRMMPSAMKTMDMKITDAKIMKITVKLMVTGEGEKGLVQR